MGRPIPVGVLPLGMALSPNGRWLAVLNDGFSGESISLIDTRICRVISTTPVSMAFNGILFSADGRTLWVAGGGQPRILCFNVQSQSGVLRPGRSIPVSGFPTALALSPDGKWLACSENYGNHLAIINTTTDKVVDSKPAGPMPYGVAWSGSGIWATSWADGALRRVSSPTSSLPLGKLAGAVIPARSGSILLACAVNEDRMVVIDTQRAAPRIVGKVSFAPYPGAPAGSVPGALAVNPHSGAVYVALSGLNAVAIVDPHFRRVKGYIPTGWYPSALAVAPDGSRLYVAAAKGLGSGPNKLSHKNVAVGNRGIVFAVPLSGAGSVASKLRTWTHGVLANNNLPPRLASHNSTADLPPVRHVVYIVKENKTFDQVLGDLGRGNGDASLTMYGKTITPNTHALANQFVLADSFFSDGEVSVQGHEWTLGSNSPDYAERTWPQIYAGHSRLDDITTTPVSYPAGGYLMRSCVKHGISCRMYGDEMMRDANGKVLPELRDHVCKAYAGWDLHYPDTEREAIWEKEFHSGIFPGFSYLWLPDDHTAGTAPGYRTPQAMVAGNDLALARVVDAISHSRYWKDTVIFIVEDDSQSGLDHVDSHRNILIVASPWVKRGALTHRHYSQVSVNRTIELLLGLQPLSQYDALTSPILDIFTRAPDTTSYHALPETVNLRARNSRDALFSKESAQLDLSEPDTDSAGRLKRILLADARAFNRRNITGRKMPAFTHQNNVKR